MLNKLFTLAFNVRFLRNAGYKRWKPFTNMRVVQMSMKNIGYIVNLSTTIK